MKVHSKAAVAAENRAVNMQTGDDNSEDDDDLDDRGVETDTPSVETWYSWWIATVVVIGHLLFFGLSWTVGIYQIIFLEAFQEPAWSTSIIVSMNTAAIYFFGPIGGVLQSHVTCRCLNMIGVAVIVIGLLLSFWATNIYILYLTFGLMAGGGGGLAFIPMITIVARYFDKHRAVALGLASGGIGLGVLIMPSIIHHLNETYGWRGSLMMLSAIMAQFMVLVTTMTPIHLPEDDKHDDSLCEKPPERSFFQYLELDVFQEKRFILLCLSNLFLMIGNSVFYVHMAAYARTQGLQQTPLYIALGSALTVGRVSFGFVGQWRRLSPVLVYSIALVITGLVVVIVPHVTGVAGILTVVSAFGFFSAVIGPFMPQLCIIFIGIQKMAAAYGYLMVFEGTGSLFGAPIAGSLFDQTEIYDYSFYVGGCSFILAGLVMLPAWRWVQPSVIRQREDERSQLSLHITHNDVHNKLPSSTLNITTNQSIEMLADCLSRAVSHSSIAMSRSRHSLHGSRFSLPRSFSSRLPLDQHTRDAERVPIACTATE